MQDKKEVRFTLFCTMKLTFCLTPFSIQSTDWLTDCHSLWRAPFHSIHLMPFWNPRSVSQDRAYRFDGKWSGYLHPVTVQVSSRLLFCVSRKPGHITLPLVVITHELEKGQVTLYHTLLSLGNGNLFGFSTLEITSRKHFLTVGFEVLTAVAMERRVLSSGMLRPACCLLQSRFSRYDPQKRWLTFIGLHGFVYQRNSLLNI